MKQNSNNTKSENKKADNIMAKVINYAAELLKQGASVETMSKYGHIFYEIRKGNEYVCLCTSDFVKAAEIANGENNTQSETTTATANESKKESRAARVWATVCARLATLWAILSDYAAGTWAYTIKPAATKFGRKVAKVITRAALYLFRFVWFAAIAAATIGTMGAVATLLADMPHTLTAWIRIPFGLVAVFGSTLAVEVALLAISKRIDRATGSRLLAMH